MRIFNRRITGILLGASLALGSLTPAFADDTEIYVGAVSTVKPNILLLIDTSISMDATDATDDHPTFDPTKTIGSYSVKPAGCDDTRIFYTVGANAAPPTCASTNYIRSDTGSYQRCDKLFLATQPAASAPSGRWTGKAAQFNVATKTWEDLKPNGITAEVECLADRGVHGQTTGNNAKYARNGNATPWINSEASEINWAQRQTYTFYSARWVVANSQTAGTFTLSRIQAVKNAVYDMVSSIDDVNVGVMRFNGVNNAAANNTDAQYQGGVVTKSIKDVTTSRNDIIENVKGFTTNSATPLSELLHEAGLYWSGGRPEWGNNGSVDPAAISGGNYVSPITESCQRNFNIILTDGRPTWDNQDDAKIEALYGGACTGQPGETNSGPATPPAPNTSRNAGRCLDEMSTYLARDTTDLSSALTGNQRAKTFTIGFGGNDPAAFDFLTEVATDGGGTRYLANNVASLNAALTAIATEISNISSTFATASIGVNSFNRAATRDDLYFAVFNSDDHLKWDGNLKKYKLVAYDADPADAIPPKLMITGTATNLDAVGSDGFFKDGVQSFWSPSPDGNKVTEGGAASRLPTTRTILTHLGANPAGTFANLIPIDSTAVNDTVLGTPVGAVTRASVLSFATSVSPKRMGDPLHSQPSVVTYAGAATSTPTDVVYTATNDGYLHAVDADTGIEKWAFIPEELLKRLKDLVADPAATTRSYGLDGDIRIVKLDFNGDGNVNGDDVVWLFVGMRRGGKYYYGLDVTNRNAPKLMWKIGPGEMTDIGETWSPPTVARVAVAGASQNNQKLVLIFGGGYDGAQENYTQVEDNQGNNIWMVDAKSGSVLWSAGDTGHNLNLAAMTNSITGRISVIDINGDGYADRMYAADLGGRVFRFDIFSGSNASALVTGAVFAKLGNGKATGGNEAPSPASNTRRFYNAPDVALIQRRGADPYYNLAIGSGYRGHPLHRPALDRFYSLRDKQPYAKLTTAQAAALVPITEATTGFVNITADPINANVGASSPGWMLVLDRLSAQTGEKVLNEATTVNGVILFSTYAPQTASSAEPCRPTSLNKVYALRADNGHPALDLNGDGVINNDDLYENVVHEGILGGVNVGVLRGELADALGGTPTVCLAGMHILGKCVNVSDSVRTYWRKDVDQP